MPAVTKVLGAAEAHPEHFSQRSQQPSNEFAGGPVVRSASPSPVPTVVRQLRPASPRAAYAAFPAPGTPKPIARGPYAVVVPRARSPSPGAMDRTRDDLCRPRAAAVVAQSAPAVTCMPPNAYVAATVTYKTAARPCGMAATSSTPALSAPASYMPSFGSYVPTPKMAYAATAHADSLSDTTESAITEPSHVTYGVAYVSPPTYVTYSAPSAPFAAPVAAYTTHATGMVPSYRTASASYLRSESIEATGGERSTPVPVASLRSLPSLPPYQRPPSLEGFRSCSSLTSLPTRPGSHVPAPVATYTATAASAVDATQMYPDGYFGTELIPTMSAPAVVYAAPTAVSVAYGAPATAGEPMSTAAPLGTMVLGSSCGFTGPSYTATSYIAPPVLVSCSTPTPTRRRPPRSAFDIVTERHYGEPPATPTRGEAASFAHTSTPALNFAPVASSCVAAPGACVAMAPPVVFAVPTPTRRRASPSATPTRRKLSPSAFDSMDKCRDGLISRV